MMNSRDDFIGPVNIGNPEEFTISELAEKVIALTDSNSKIVYGPLPPDDPKQRQPSIDLAQNELKWEQKIELKQGLQKTIAYFNDLLSNNSI